MRKLRVTFWLHAILALDNENPFKVDESRRREISSQCESAAARSKRKKKNTKKVRKDQEEKEQKRQGEKKERTRGGIRKRRSATAHLRIVMLTPAREVTIGTKHNGEIPAGKGAREVVEAESKGWQGTRAGKRYRIIVLRRLVAGTRSALT